ncbi:MAG: hypothetical protein HYS13_13595 [Planctomycetia bacterium]|nr:hypothetical protein [Planctomycetia bacterium]
MFIRSLFALALSLALLLLPTTLLAAPPAAESLVAAAPQDKAADDKPAAKDPAANPARKPDGTKFVRLVRAGDEVVAMETAITSYVGTNEEGEKVQVDLIGAIHIGDTAYYKKLNKEFDGYESVLYELVAPKGTVPPRGTAGVYSPIAGMLDLDDQIAVIDYEKDRLIHADMSWDELREAMEKRDESLTKLFFQMIGQGVAQQSSGKGPSDADVLAALLFADDRPVAMKRIFATQFENMEQATAFLEGPNGSALITERNGAAFKVLKEQLGSGQKKIGVFYGAGHFTDMERRLVDDFQLKKGEQRWLVCWDLHGKAKKSKPKKDAPKP